MNEVYFYSDKQKLYFTLSPLEGKFKIRFVTDDGLIFETADDQEMALSLLKESRKIVDEKELAKLYLLDFKEVVNDV